MGFFSWIVVGLIAGLLAKWIMPGDQKAGLLVTLGLGVVGGFVGGWITSLLGWGTMDGISLVSILVATAGALLLLVIYGLVTKKR